MATNAFTTTTTLPELLAETGREMFDFDEDGEYTFDGTFPGLVDATRPLFGDCKARLAPEVLGEDEPWFEWAPGTNEDHREFWNAEGLRAVAAMATTDYEWSVYYQYNPGGEYARVMVLVWFADDPSPPVSVAIFEIENRVLGL